MAGIWVTIFLYISLFYGYFLVYPSTEKVVEGIVWILLTIAFLIFNLMRQNIWLINPKIRNKSLIYIISSMNILAFILIFMAHVVWKLLVESLYVSILLASVMFLHVLFISVQTYQLNKQNLSWSNEFNWIDNESSEIEKTAYYKNYLKPYLRYTFIFSFVYLMNDFIWIRLILIIGNCLYACYAYHKAWKKGYMENIIGDHEKNNFYIANVLISIITISFVYYIPVFLGMVMITLPDVLIRKHQDRYMTAAFLKKTGFLK